MEFHLYSLKVSANAKIAMQYFENFGGEQMPQMAHSVFACPSVVMRKLCLSLRAGARWL